MAKEESKAYEEALQIFSQKLGREVSRDEIELVDMENKKSFFGLRKKQEFVFQLKESGEQDELAAEKGMATEEESELDGTLDLHGFFKLQILSHGIFLRVHAPEGKGHYVDLRAVKKILEQKEIQDVDLELVEQVVEESTGEPVQIAERRPELDRDAELQVNISKDEMEAYCTYIPPLGGDRLNIVEAVRLLNAYGVQYGIDESKVERLLEDNIKQEMLIAKGKPAESGKPAELRYYFTAGQDKKHVKELENGKVDFLNLDLVANVKRGDLLVSKISPTEGIPGMAVTGREVKPEPGKDIKLPKGKNVEVGPDELSLFATIDGQVVMEDQKINVLPIYTVNGDVDLETGNINFIGNVVIKGSVQEGFSIKADGDIEIMGNVGGATLEAEGSITVHKGFQGKQKGLLKANGDVHCGFIENGQVVTRGSLFVKGAVMHSKIVAKMNIVVEGRGLIVGGSIQAGNDVEARMIGSHLATPTEIMAGVDPEIRQELEQVNVEIEAGQENMDKVVKGIELLERAARSMSKLPAQKQAMLDQFQKTRQHVEGQMQQLLDQQEMLNRQLKEQKNGRIKVQEFVFPGVKVNIGQYGYRVKDKMSRTVFAVEDGEVVTRPL